MPDDLQAAITLLEHSPLVLLLRSFAGGREPLCGKEYVQINAHQRWFELVPGAAAPSYQPNAQGTALLTVLAAAARVPALEAKAQRYEALSRLHCELHSGDDAVGIAAILRNVPVFLQSVGSRELNALTDDLLAQEKEGSKP